MKKTLLALAAIAVVVVACDDDDNYVIPTPVDRVVVGFNGDTTVNTINLSSVATDMPTVTAVAFPDNATNKEIYWISSEPGVIAIDSKTGVMTRTDSVLTQISNVVITARAVNALDGTATITLGKGEFVEEVSIAQSDVMLDVSTKAGAQLPTLSASVAPTTVLDKTLTWSSSHPEILAINPTTGVLSIGNGAASANATVVTITAKAVNGVKDEIQVKVGEGELPEQLVVEAEASNYSISKGTHVQSQADWLGIWSGGAQIWWLSPTNNVVDGVLTMKFNSTIKSECKFTLRCTKAEDFGTYTVKVNGQIVKTGLNLYKQNPLIAEDFILDNCTLVRGENTVEVICTAGSSKTDTSCGIDKLTFDVVTTN